MKKSWMGVLVIIIFSILCVPSLFAASDQIGEVPKISKEELKAILGDPDLVIIDTLLTEQWELIDKKLPGAVREDSENVASWADKYPKDKTIVVY